MQNTVLIVDFGSRYTQLIGRHIRALDIYCEIYPFQDLPENLSGFKAVILSGSPYDITQKDAPGITLSAFRGKIPVLGIDYGAQILAKAEHGEVQISNNSQFKNEELKVIERDSPLFEKIPNLTDVWIREKDTFKNLPKGFKTLAGTETVKNAVFKIKGEPTYGVQFHPEVATPRQGKDILKNFLVHIAKIDQNWTAKTFVSDTVRGLKEKIGADKVVLGLSGGVDSTVTAVLLNKAVGEHLYCIFVNHGLLRKNEYEEVLEQYKNMGLNVKGVDASERFLSALNGVSDPEQKRKIIGKLFIEVFEEEAQKLANVRFLGQGTIYPDVIESVSFDGSVSVKSHHNVGGLPERMNLKVVEPLRSLFKDEVRHVGREMRIGTNLLGRHPFPGPGLAIRILGAITLDKLTVLKEADAVFTKALRKWGLYDKVWQAGVILLPINSVGKKADQRTYEKVVALRAVQTTNGMTADWVNLPYDFLQEVSDGIIETVEGVNRVVYDISAKPPATIEWE